MDRSLLTKLHLVFAAFMFPAVLMFLVTGALYTWGNKGAWHEETVSFGHPMPATELTEAQLTQTALAAIEDKGLPEPSGSLSITTGPDVSLSWTGARSEVSLVAGDQPNLTDVTVKQASFHRWLVQLHKAKGSTWFKVYATALAIVLFLLVASGLIMGLQVKSMRRLTAISSIAGLGAFVGFVALG